MRSSNRAVWSIMPALPELGGSSPLARGTRCAGSTGDGAVRFISAGAGNAHHKGVDRCARPVQPPRVRGTPAIRAGMFLRDRFSPAGAGNAPAYTPPVAPTSVQPRGCGERQAIGSRNIGRGGSAPRVRGTLVWTIVRHHRRRFSPAGAGNAHTDRCLPPTATVQPRGCGERSSVYTTGRTNVGSAPRVRGTPGHRQPEHRQRRFSPAGAGNAPATGRAGARTPVQPRGCGERSIAVSAKLAMDGSAPRVRGTRSGAGR